MPQIRFFSSKKIPNNLTLLKFAKKICAQEKNLRNNGEICVQFISDRQIRQLNRTFLNHDRPTDVIAFNYPNLANLGQVHETLMFHVPVPNLPFGDIYISVDTAASQANKGGYSLSQELALLILHGLLHLAGYEDKTPKKKKRMFSRQRALFKQLAPALSPPDIGN